MKFILFLMVFVFSNISKASSDREIIKPTSNFSKVEQYESYPGGATTHSKRLNGDVFSFPSNNMGFERQLRFTIGNRLFTREWVSAPSSTENSGGIGPLFNARSCQACHFKDGRGHLPSAPTSNLTSLILKLDNAGKSDSIYGAQFQDFSVQGVPKEGAVEIQYSYTNIELADGEIVQLRKPIFSLKELNYGELDQDTKLLPRIAPQMIGLGLLEVIDEADIVAGIDENDSNGDGVIGRANFIMHNGVTKLGRFGWKSETADLEHQTQVALLNDMGLSSKGLSSNYGDCTRSQKKCLELTSKYAKSNSTEIGDALLKEMTFYVRNLAVPARRAPGASDVLSGKKLFYESGCIACHRPKFITPVSEQHPEQSRQLIWPYSDLLLHDLGQGLADPGSSQSDKARLWRTPPLWGIGLTSLVNREYGFLHDGRARNVLEAILWHDGEASNSKKKVVNMTTDQRRKLLLFIDSL